jgi:hypothetical protein
MATIIPAKDVGKVFADAVNKALEEIPDDKTKQAVLDAFSKQMFYGENKSRTMKARRQK